MSEEIYLNRYNALNVRQKNAVDAIDGPVLVVAGPGSGKTEILSLRVANILLKTDTLPSSILCLTFTDAAAANMRSRLAQIIGQEAYKVAIHTFHSFGREIINSNPDAFYNGAFYNPADEIVQIEIMQKILDEMDSTLSLNKRHPELGYTYIRDIKSKITELKRAGLSPEEFKNLLNQNKEYLSAANPLITSFFEARISKDSVKSLSKLIGDLSAINLIKIKLNLRYKSVKDTLIESLSEALAECESEEKISTKPLTEWKKTFLKKNFKNETVLKDYLQLKKQFELADVYKQYQNALSRSGFYDFDDMLMDTVKAIETNDELKFNVQEKYQYVLIDEFQDTSGVQMRMVEAVLNNELYEGRPNVMAVGDDDQSIYKFQGAYIDNILSFQEKYKNPTLVVLTDNYRSSAGIIDYSREVILLGKKRLETIYPDLIVKKLNAAKKNPELGRIAEKSFQSEVEEFMWVKDEIEKRIKDGAKYGEIAVISRKHHVLTEMAKVLDEYKIPVVYERKKNLLEQEHIKQLITILKFVDSVIKKNDDVADELLPEILAYPFWQLKRIDIWKISLEAKRKRKEDSWLEVMLNFPATKKIAEFLVQLGIEAKEKTAEEIIDFITGTNGVQLEEGADTLFKDAPYFSPYKEFYFSKSEYTENRSRYLDFLKALQQLFRKIRNYRSKTTLSVHDVVEYIELHQKHNIAINYSSQPDADSGAVNLITAHGSKGLEYDTVFIIDCSDECWFGRTQADKISFPSNLPIAAESDSDDDKLRIFYVALTRAKNNLYLTRHLLDNKGKELTKLRLLKNEEETKVSVSLEDFIKVTNAAKKLVLDSEENQLMKNILVNYKLNVTHLLNFLSLDKGGPEYFFQQNLLNFPQRYSSSQAYGNAYHEALNKFQMELKLRKSLPSLKFFQESFIEALKAQRLNKKDFAQRSEQGLKNLAIYYEQKIQNFRPEDKSEYDFGKQNVIVNGVPLRGKADKMILNGREIKVVDYKTGKALTSWEGKGDFEEIKLWKFKMQLKFYKILIENCREFTGKYSVKQGVIDFLDPFNDGVEEKYNMSTLTYDIPDGEVEDLYKLIGVVYKKIIILDFPDISGYEKNMYGIMSFVEDLIEGRV